MTAVRANLRVAAPDGAGLATDVYLPGDGSTAAPVVVTRTAYDRSAHLHEGLGWAGHGYAFVVQDVRGRYDSDGAWRPYRAERADGAALADWIAAQPWCDGRLVALGGSYSAYTAWTMAVERPALVAGLVSLGPAMGLARVKFDRSGILRLAEHAAWWLERAEARTSRTGIAAAMFAAEPDLLRHLPVAGLPERMWARLERWGDALDDGAPEAVTDAEIARVAAATLHVGGWYDLLVDETLHQWRQTGAAHAPRPPRSLLIGPWEHDLCWSPSTVVGDRDHGPESRVPPGPLLLDWLERALGDRPGDTSARVFVAGAGRWWTGEQWPPETVPSTWYTGAGGTLAREAAGDAADGYRYDPADPYPSADPGADRSALQDRADALRYTAEPLTEPVTIAGAPTVTLHATTTAPGTDFVARLLECRPGGAVLAIAQGAVDTGRGHPPYHIELDHVAVTVPAGARLRLELTSSDFPQLARNLNTGADRYRTAALAAAVQTVHSGRSAPTAVTLPVLETPWTPA
ncbi:CocE/NonD family hydrolase [Dactylosporangium sp. CA-092794]|uniref:CocE/NonD family hydrolase n=1 Tax=Dactylosporangium sp. CA-092794 TaxID=3239929 RepID=UPI003D8E3202